MSENEDQKYKENSWEQNVVLLTVSIWVVSSVPNQYTNYNLLFAKVNL